MERLTAQGIEAIRKRAEAATAKRSIRAVYPERAFEVLTEDIPALLAEVERLSGIMESHDLDGRNYTNRQYVELRVSKERCVKVALSRQAYITKLQAEVDRMLDILTDIGEVSEIETAVRELVRQALGDDAVDDVESAMHEHYTDMALEMEDSE